MKRTAMRAMTLLATLCGAHGFQPNKAPSKPFLSQRRGWLSSDTVRLYYSNNAAFDMDDAAQPLSTSDILLLQSLRRRQVRLPIMVLDTLLPDQVVTLRSSDPIFARLLQHATSHSDGRVAVVGLHPTTKNPLSYGVLADIEKMSQFQSDSSTVRITALQRIHVSGDIVEQRRKGFSIADCEIMNDSHERSHGDNVNAPRLAARLRTLIERWTEKVSTAGAIVRETLPTTSLEKELSPKEWTSLAFYAATLLSVPVAVAETGIDIRPAMITAQTAYERLALAVTALQVHLGDHESSNH